MVIKRIISLVLMLFVLCDVNQQASARQETPLAQYKVEKIGDILKAQIINGTFKLNQSNQQVEAYDLQKRLVGRLPLISADLQNTFKLKAQLSDNKQEMILTKVNSSIVPLPSEVKAALTKLTSDAKVKAAKKAPSKPKAKKPAPPKHPRYIPETERFWLALDNLQNLLHKNSGYQFPVYGSSALGAIIGGSIGQWGSLISVPFVLIPIIGPLIFFPMASISLYSAFTTLGTLIGAGVGARLGALVTLDPKLNKAAQVLLDKILSSNSLDR